MADYHPRIVSLYDNDNPDGPDHDFYRALARDASRIIDLGCGTGILTVTLAGQAWAIANGPKRTVIGVDPSTAMLDYARQRPGAENVTWIEGDSRRIPGRDAELAIMSGNVAQHIPDSHWKQTLADLRKSMAQGGVLAFESRNLQARAWESWGDGEKTSRMTDHGLLVEWEEVTTADDRTVKLTSHNMFADAEETVTESQRLIFRSRSELEESLHDCGFAIEAVYGDWGMTLFTESAPLMIVVARAC